jgi:pantetheine-phosphate adenylyltransferase
METKAVYPGSFDPVTNGHMDLIRRGLKIFDRIIVAVLHNPAKKSFFTVEERMEMLRESLSDCENVVVDSFAGLLVDYCVQRDAPVIIRGMRAVSDFEYEFQLALMNRRLNRDVQTVFMMTGLQWIFTSSSIIKEAARFGGDISGMVPPVVEQRLKAKMGSLS